MTSLKSELARRHDIHWCDDCGQSHSVHIQLDATPEQVENAAEIALEHHLGLICDPVMGLVQIPCIKCNRVGAVKAIAAVQLSLSGDGIRIVPFDTAVETMRSIGNDMHDRYKKTSLGGLALFVTAC